MKVLTICSALLLSNTMLMAQVPAGQNFGDQVAECANLRSKANPGKAPQDFFSECENYVQRGRDADAFQKQRDDQFHKAQLDFASCVRKNIPRLDDGRSSAEVIATGVFGSCQNHFSADVSMSKEFAEAVTPNLTAKVLEYRATHKKQTLKPAKPVL